MELMDLVNLASVKKYLRIDFDGDDEILEIIMQAAADYIKSAVGDFNADDPRVKLLFLNITASMYENRLYSVDTTNEKLSWINSSLLLQLQLESEDYE